LNETTRMADQADDVKEETIGTAVLL